MAQSTFVKQDPVAGHIPKFAVLTDAEILTFFHDLDKDKNGYVTFEELEQKLEQVHEEIAPEPQTHHLHHPQRRFLSKLSSHSKELDAEKGYHNPEHDGLHAFLFSLMPDCSSKISKEEFIKHVRTWEVPSQQQTSSENEDAEDSDYEKHMTLGRRLRAYWSVDGPRALLISFVVSLQLAFGFWQMVTYIKKPETRRALGWGVILAKACAGALYPTLFFMILSMSRHFATYMRRFYYLSRFFNWDRHQSFHIWMALVGLFLATLHSIGHLTGTFLYGSRPAQQPALAVILGSDNVPKPYVGFVRTLPGWSGIVALGLFWIISILSLPWVRVRSYEIFQLGHVLMFPMIGLLCAHGTAEILQEPMLGYWLAFPTLLVTLERTLRIVRGFRKVPARVEILDADTVSFTCKHPRGKNWRYEAGQYIFLQVPSISFFQWHPFTISSCVDNILQVHIKTDGDWTERLRALPLDCDVNVGIDGPFGAPAQRFYDFDRTLIIGSGVGITPFSAILTDLEQKIKMREDPWAKSSRRSSRTNSRRTSIASISSSANANVKDREEIEDAKPSHLSKISNDDSPIKSVEDTGPDLRTVDQSLTKISIAEPSRKPNLTSARRVDFHWMVREKNYLLWFASLLNRAYDLSLSVPESSLDLNIHTHITMKRKNISTHIFRYLLDAYRTPSAPYSALTGLKLRSQFGRPNLTEILENFHRDIRKDIEMGGKRCNKVGVFFCGSPKIGRVLADTCSELTAKARIDGSKIRYIFMMEVFG